MGAVLVEWARSQTLGICRPLTAHTAAMSILAQWRCDGYVGEGARMNSDPFYWIGVIALGIVGSIVVLTVCTA